MRQASTDLGPACGTCDETMETIHIDFCALALALLMAKEPLGRREREQPFFHR